MFGGWIEVEDNGGAMAQRDSSLLKMDGGEHRNRSWNSKQDMVQACPATNNDLPLTSLQSPRLRVILLYYRISQLV